jgi:hypothetical protein
MNVNAVLLLAAIGAIGFFLSKFLVRKDTQIEDRRRRAIQLSNWAAVNGLPLISRLLVSYSVGDYSSLKQQVGEVSELLADDAEAKAAVGRFLNVQLDRRLATSEGREEIIALVEKKLNLKIDRAAITPEAVEVGTKV